MATLTLIGEAFPDGEAAVHAEAARELTQFIAETAPRGCSARLLIGSEREAPTFTTARARTERLPLRAHMLPKLWRAGLTARPLDGEFVHSPTPLVPLRSRDEDDGSQTSVMVPHPLGWLAPDRMGASAARQYRAFVKRAVRLADVVVTPTHAVAEKLYERFGAGITVQVIPLAPPRAFLASADSAERRAALRLPERYIVTTATPHESGRLSWILNAMERDAAIPPLVVLRAPTAESEAAATASAADPARDSGKAEGSGSAGTAGAAAKTGNDPADEISVPDAVRDRVRVVRPRELADVGAVFSGADLYAVPQSLIGAGYDVLAALAAGLPIVHGGCAACSELALDAGVGAEDADGFAEILSQLSGDDSERRRLAVFAEDRSRTFSWAITAQLLWELHANI